MGAGYEHQQAFWVHLSKGYVSLELTWGHPSCKGRGWQPSARGSWIPKGSPVWGKRETQVLGGHKRLWFSGNLTSQVSSWYPLKARLCAKKKKLATELDPFAGHGVLPHQQPLVLRVGDQQAGLHRPKWVSAGFLFFDLPQVRLKRRGFPFWGNQPPLSLSRLWGSQKEPCLPSLCVLVRCAQGSQGQLWRSHRSCGSPDISTHLFREQVSWDLLGAKGARG